MSLQTSQNNKELRKFGFTMFAVIAVIGGFLLWRERPAAPYILGIAGFFAAASLLYPRILIPIEKAWLKFAEVMSRIMTRVILVLTYYLAMTPVGFLMRLTGRDPLNRKLEPERASYWEPVETDGPGSRPYKPY